MAEIKKGILGGFSGTVGTVVGSNWRGKDIIKSRPKTTNKPPTDRQLEQCVKFAAAIAFLSPLKQILSAYFGTDSGTRSRVNLATSYLIMQAIEMNDGLPRFLYSKVLMTKGDLAGFQNLSVTPAAGNRLDFAWEDNSTQARAAVNDVFCCVAYSEELQQFASTDGPALRQDGSASVAMPPEFTGKSVHLYAYFRNAAANAACNSVYLGSVTPA